MIFGRVELDEVESGSDKQWLVANGLGGFASSTIAGVNTSKYHGLLFAALRPPGERTLLLAKLEEEIIINKRSYQLGANFTATGTYPHGNKYLQSFELRPFPTYTFSVEDLLLEKTVFMIYGSNISVIRYTAYCPENQNIDLKITPYVNCRNFHHTVRKNDWAFRQEIEDNSVTIEAYPGAPRLKVYSDRAKYVKNQGHWFEGIFYRQEQQRGLDPWEDHYMPGYFEVTIGNGQSFSIIASTENERIIRNPLLEQVTAERRLVGLVEKAGYQEEFINRLIFAADSFIVERHSTGAKTVIAGYPWFSDWGRDTMIALPGLTLVTGRFDEAKEILKTFAKYCRNGLIPNMFPDDGTEPLYNTVDAPLWFFHAVSKYLSYTKDDKFVREDLFPVLSQIIEYYSKGTDFNIKADQDGLIMAGEHGCQLTWMDAKVGDWVVTPRHGKPVEINALWYNALEIMTRLAEKYDSNGAYYAKMAAKVRTHFVEKYWNTEKRCLFDVIIDEKKDDSVRPNQILAVSLNYSPLDHSKQVDVVNKVWTELYFSYGLRSLSPQNNNYHGKYMGNMVERDSSYHQGTGWGWLIGPFVTAYCKVNDYSAESIKAAEKFISPFKAHLWEHGIGSVSEIFDGDPPHYPRGCFSQAWSVAEVLRAYVEDIMGKRP